MDDTPYSALSTCGSAHAATCATGVSIRGIWHGTLCDLNDIPVGLRLEIGAAHALAMWCRHSGDVDGTVSVAAGWGFDRCVARLEGAKSSKYIANLAGAVIDSDMARHITDSRARGTLVVARKTHQLGVCAAVAAALGDEQAREALAAHLETLPDITSDDRARAERIRTRSRAVAALVSHPARITCDASYHPSSHSGAWAAVASDGRCASGPLAGHAHNSSSAELEAIRRGLEHFAATLHGPIEVCSDNAAAVAYVSTLTDGSSNTTHWAARCDQEHAAAIAAIAASRVITARWVPGHAGVIDNIRADALAGATAAR